MEGDESHITGMNPLEGTSNPTVVQGPESGLCSALQGGWGTTTVHPGLGSPAIPGRAEAHEDRNCSDTGGSGVEDCYGGSESQPACIRML